MCQKKRHITTQFFLLNLIYNYSTSTSQIIVLHDINSKNFCPAKIILQLLNLSTIQLENNFIRNLSKNYNNV